jgi:hypothetical protein
MAEMLKVEYDELMARAAELEVPLPAAPVEYAQTPCVLSFIVAAGAQLGYNNSAVGQSLELAEQEYISLAESLRNAALAYEEADQAVADSINNEASQASLTSRSVSGKRGASAMTIAEPPPPDYGAPGFYDLRQAAEDIEAPDQGIAFTSHVEKWREYALILQSDAVMRRFRPFEYWEGASAEAVEASFEEQKRYLLQLVSGSCYPLASQAERVVAAHKVAIVEHPSTYDLYAHDVHYEDAIRRGDTAYAQSEIAEFDRLQLESEEVLAQYYGDAGLPLTLIYPANPPAAVFIAPPPQIPDNVGENIRGTLGDRAPETVPEVATPGPSQLPDPNISDTVSSLQNMASSQTDTSSDPFATTTAPPLPTGIPGLSTGGVKPASFGGGGGVPSAPLQSPSADAEAGGATRPTASGVGAPPGAPGAAAGRGGAMGGGMPMGAGAGQGQGKDSKAKRYGEEEDIYTEDRPWTSSVIGVRRRNDAPE